MIDKVERLLKADTVEAVWAVLTAQMDDHGFDRLFYGYTQNQTAEGLGHLNDLLVLSNHDEEYLDGFLRQRMYLSAPMTQWAVGNFGAMPWSWIDEHRDSLSREALDVVAFNHKHDVVAGYTVSFPESTRRHRAAIALTARRGLTQCDVEHIWRDHGREIEALVYVAHLKLKSLPYPEEMQKLSTRQREVLEWICDGKTTGEVAEIMGLTRPTVEKHLKNARDSLAVKTTAQAILKASMQKQIFVLYP